jgi:hypothetical protein
MVDDRFVARWTSGEGERVSGPAFQVAVTAGEHEVRMLLRLQGRGEGPWSYLKGYKFELRSTHKIVALPDRVTEVAAVAYEKGSVSTPIEERPVVRWNDGPRADAAPSPPAAVSPATCVPQEAGPLTPEQRDAMLVAICKKTVCMFSEKEEQLLVFAQSSGRAGVIDAAAEIREKRRSDVEAMCARLRAEGKL